MKLIDILNPEEIFHPQMFYTGEWLLGNHEIQLDDYLVMNSIRSGERNKYLEFLDKHFYSKLENIFNSKSLAGFFFPKIILQEGEESSKRKVCFSKEIFFYQIAQGLLNSNEVVANINELGANGRDIDFIQNYLKEELRKDRSKYSDVLRQGNKSPYYKEVFAMYLEHINQGLKLSFEYFLDSKINTLTKIIVSLKHIDPLFDNEIDYQELIKCFNFDEFCLLVAKAAIDMCMETEQECNLVNNCVSYVKYYLSCVNLIRQEKITYDCSIIAYDNSKKVKIRIDDIKKQYEDLLVRHPEFNFISIEKEQINLLLSRHGLADSEIESFDCSTKENQKLLTELLREFSEDRELAAEWEFIPKGVTSEKESHIIKKRNTKGTTKSIDERQAKLLICKECLESSPYIYKIYGMYKFDGYIGYIYPNGSVIFEKYYESFKTRKVCLSSATYIMNLYNFLRLSKLSKTEIIHIIKTDKSAKVRRIFHRDNLASWKSEINQVVAEINYTDNAVKAYINELISNNEIKKQKVLTK